MQIVNFSKDSFFLDQKRDVWKLIDITETRSLISNKKTQTFAVLLNEKTKKIFRFKFVDFESNFTKIESGLFEEVQLLDRLFNQE